VRQQSDERCARPCAQGHRRRAPARQPACVATRQGLRLLPWMERKPPSSKTAPTLDSRRPLHARRCTPGTGREWLRAPADHSWSDETINRHHQKLRNTCGQLPGATDPCDLAAGIDPRVRRTETLRIISPPRTRRPAGIMVFSYTAKKGTDGTFDV